MATSIAKPARPLTRDQVIRAIRGMPKGASVDEILERIHFLARIDQGIRDLDAGHAYTTKQVLAEIRSWRK